MDNYLNNLPPELIIHIFTFIPYRADICSVSKEFYDLSILCSASLSKYPSLYHQPLSIQLTKKLANDIIISGDCHLFTRLFGKKYLNLKSACQSGNLSIINLMIEHGANNWNYGLYGACQSGNLSVINLMIEHGANNWNYGLYYACHGGNLLIINLMIEHGANDWNNGLYGACLGGNLSIINLMIEHGANNWNIGLYGACRVGNLLIINLMIEHGATRCNNCRKPISEH
jgi:hypothetical protein